MKNVQILVLALDNFDINMETPSGADAIHHTYGICYKNIDHDKNIENIMENTNNAIGTKRKIKDLRYRAALKKKQSTPLLIFL